MSCALKFDDGVGQSHVSTLTFFTFPTFQKEYVTSANRRHHRLTVQLYDVRRVPWSGDKIAPLDVLRRAQHGARWLQERCPLSIHRLASHFPGEHFSLHARSRARTHGREGERMSAATTFGPRGYCGALSSSDTRRLTQLARSTRRSATSARPRRSLPRVTAMAAQQEDEFAVFRFTLGIPGFDDQDIPRVVGLLGASLLAVNHFLAASNPGEAQVGDCFRKTHA